MKKRLFVLTAVACVIVASYWSWMTWLPKSNAFTRPNQIDAKIAFVSATAIPVPGRPTRSQSERPDPQEIFEAVEATNVPINLWGQVVDQDGRPLSGVSVKYDYSIEHGNLMGIAWSDQERRVGEAVTHADGLFSIQGLKGHALSIVALEKSGYQFRRKEALIFDFYGSTPSGKFIPDQRKPIVLTMVQKDQMEALIHVKGSLRVRAEGTPERWNLWEGEPDPNGELAVALRREPAVLERPGQAAIWSAELQIIGGGIIEAPWDDDVRRAPEGGDLPTIAYPQTEQKRGVPHRSFYVKTADGKFGRIQVKLDAYSQGATARCSITGDMNPRPGSRNLEPDDEY